jgi:hypothetical protein
MALGKALIASELDLILTGSAGLDQYVGASAVAECKDLGHDPRERVRTIFYGAGAPGGFGMELEPAEKSWHGASTFIVQECDALIALIGGKGTSDCVQKAVLASMASPALVARFGLPDVPDALRRFPCAVWASHIDVPVRWELGGHVIEPKAVLATNDYHHLCRRALGGDVVTELPPFLAAAPIRERRLVSLLPQYPLPEWPINLLYPPHRHQSTIVRTYLDFCQSFLPKIVQACEV